MSTCRTCQHLRVQPDKNGRIMPRAGKSYRCQATIPALQPLPASVRYSRPLWPPSTDYMEPDDGEGCTFHEPRT